MLLLIPTVATGTPVYYLVSFRPLLFSLHDGYGGVTSRHLDNAI